MKFAVSCFVIGACGLIGYFVGRQNHRDRVWIDRALQSERAQIETKATDIDAILRDLDELNARLEAVCERFDCVTSGSILPEVSCSAYTFSKDECDDDPEVSSFGPSSLDQIAISADLEEFFDAQDVVAVYLSDGRVLIRKVNDRMNRRFLNRIDLALPSKIEARRFGVQKVKVVNVTKILKGLGEIK